MDTTVSPTEAALLGWGRRWHGVDVAIIGRRLDVDDVRARVADRLSYAPRWRMTEQRGVWFDDAGFHLAGHVRELAGVDAIDQLLHVIGEQLGTELIGGHPQWALGVVAVGGRTALVCVAHPAWVDGDENVHLLSELLDDHPDPLPVDPAPWTPRPAPHLADAARGSLWGVVRDPVSWWSAAAEAVSAAGSAGLARAMRSPIETPHLAAVTLSRGAMTASAAALGVSLPDVVLAVITGGLALAGEARDLTCALPLRQAIPGGIEVRPARLGLPITLREPRERAMALGDVTRALGEAGLMLPDDPRLVEPGWAAPTAHALAARAAEEPGYDVVVSHAPAPASQVYLGERRVAAVFSALPPAGRLAFAVTPYADAIQVGITASEPVTAVAEAIGAEAARMEREAA